MSASSVSPRKLRIIALHGWGQSGELFANKIGSLRTELKKVAEFFVPDGPLALSAPSSSDPASASDQREPTAVARDEEPSPPQLASALAISGSESVGVPIGQRTASLVPVFPGGRSWYDFSALEEGRSTHYEGTEVCFAFLDQYALDNGPFDGVLAFSQGGVVAAMWAARLGTLPQHMQLQFGIFFSALMPTDPAEIDGVRHCPASRATRAFQSLHIYGSDDKIILPEKSLELAGVFGGSESWGATRVWTHEGGHVVPSASRKEVKDFVSRFVTSST